MNSAQPQEQGFASKTGDFIKKYYPHVFILIGFLAPFISTIVLSTSVGTPDSNQEIRKYVSISAPVIAISMIMMAIGSWIYFSRQPQYVVYFALTAGIFAIGISLLALCISLIDKQIS